jgi:hypothetical protein
MLKKQIKVPKFRTEAEEAEWWDAHPEVATEIMKRAIKIKTGKAKWRGRPAKKRFRMMP